MDEGVRTYDVTQLKENNEVLNELGVKLYFMDGWEFFSLLIENIDFFREQDDGAWYSACQVGISRSDLFNQLIRKLGLASTSREDKSKDPSQQGMSLWDLLIKVSEGEAEDGLLFPDGFKVGFNRVVFFVRPSDMKKEQVLRLISSSILETKKQNENDTKDVVFFIVEADEGEIQRLVRLVESSIDTLNPKQIASNIQTQFNPEKGIINFDPGYDDQEN